MPMARTWNGMTIQSKIDRANARALIGFSMDVSREAKIITHRISGSLARSIHAAPVHYEGYETDEAAAQGGDDLMMSFVDPAIVSPSPMQMVEVGSWMPYACVEWVGRGHPGITQALEISRPRMDRYMMQAYSEEGLAI